MLNSITRRGIPLIRSESATAMACTRRARPSGPMSTSAVAKVEETVIWSVVSSPRGTGMARSSPTKSMIASR